jgi:Na+/serine symporter
MKTRSTTAGGIFLFVGPVGGAIYGISRDQPIQWMLIGFCIGVALAIVVWLMDKRRG